jgi:hypothetical protein
MKHIKHGRPLFYALLLFLVSLGSYSATLLITGGTPSIIAQTPPPGGPPTDLINRQIAEWQRQRQADSQLPRFRGVLGDFEIVATEAEASPGLLCSTGFRVRPEGSRDFVASELNKPGMNEQMACSDNVAVATYSTTGRKSYFVGNAKVHVDAPASRLVLTQVDGNPALIVKPAADDGPTFIYVIKRRPSQAAPTQEARGILIGLFEPTEPRAIERARTALAE